MRLKQKYVHYFYEVQQVRSRVHTVVTIGVAVLPQSDLDVLNLLRNSRQHPLLQSVKLVKAAPGTDLTQTDKDASHGLTGQTSRHYPTLKDQNQRSGNREVVLKSGVTALPALQF